MTGLVGIVINEITNIYLFFVSVMLLTIFRDIWSMNLIVFVGEFCSNEA